MTQSPALHVRGIEKRFGGVRALHGVELTVARGEIHGLVGANGSGKSTLVKILAGYHPADAGRVEAWGEEVPLPVRDPSRHGIATIHQDLGLIESLPIVENVMERTAFGTRGGRPINWRNQRRRVAALLDRLGIPLDPRMEVATLTRGERTLVAIARAISEMEAGGGDERRHLLVVDEPTAALSSSEAEAVYELLRAVAAEGGAALFISHHLHEIKAVCDRTTVLRAGEVVGTYDSAAVTERDLVVAMLGSELAKETPLEPGAAPAAPEPAADAEPVLRVSGLRTGVLQDISFEVHRGEILGITGLLGMGQDEMPYVLAGARPRRAGTIAVDGRPVDVDPATAADAGIALVPAERRRDGLWMAATASENMGIAATRRYWRRGRYDRRGERAAARELAERFDVVPRTPEALASAFSGGNQQKILLAKWLQLEPRVVLLHEPTQGVDAGAKLEIHRLIRDFASRTGAAVVVFSSDEVEVAELCHRVLVMSRGRIIGTLDRQDLSTRRILELANAVEAA